MNYSEKLRRGMTQASPESSKMSRHAVYILIVVLYTLAGFSGLTMVINAI